MTSKHYKQLANTLHTLLRTGELQRSGVYYIINQLESANANFDRDAFSDALGLREFAHG
mgnify:FL=1|tara:strand:- start:37156 stop:37332 length:177 start_codon:yes stop_codon:yes gene_type:complete